MQAIILAAGMGRRLGELTDGDTKCMLKVSGVRLIDRMLDNLSVLDINRVIIVIGYKGENVKKHIGVSYKNMDIVYVENNIFDKTNNIYSLFLAKDYLIEDDTILMESDLIFDSKILPKIIDHPYPNIALVDKYESWMDGTVITLDDDNFIINFIPKKNFKYDEISLYFKTVNIYKFSKEFSISHYVPFLKAYSAALGNNEYYEQVLRVVSLVDNNSIKALPLEGEKWYEIDDIQDLDIAESIFARNDDEQWEAYNSRYGGYWRYPKMLDYCYLVNPYFPNKKLLNEIKYNFEVLIREYPSGMGVNSLLAAKYFGINKNFVVVGNGAAELIKAYIENYVETLGVTCPTFEEYPNRLEKDKIVSFTPQNDDFSYNAQDLISFFSNKQITTLLLINPDNPSGNFIPFEDLLEVVKWTKESRIKLIVDESFVDFAKVDGLYSLLDNKILSENHHLVVIKSISKSYGVPGIRLGVLASGDDKIISKLKKDVAIWNINSFGEFYMQIFGKYEDDYIEACKLFIAERERFYNNLITIPFLRVIPSQANYFLCELIGGLKSKDLAIELLKKHEILIKDCSTKVAFGGDKQYIRLAVRGTDDNNRLIKSLRSCINLESV